MTFLKAILFTAIGAFLALCGVWIMRIIKPGNEWEMIVWAIIFSVLMLGHNFVVVYRFKKQQKAEDIRNGKRSIG